MDKKGWPGYVFLLGNVHCATFLMFAEEPIADVSLWRLGCYKFSIYTQRNKISTQTHMDAHWSYTLKLTHAGTRTHTHRHMWFMRLRTHSTVLLAYLQLVQVGVEAIKYQVGFTVKRTHTRAYARTHLVSAQVQCPQTSKVTFLRH